ncbi:MAG: TRAP transporter substrate-binding protein DctP, partial [Dehalococcoidales bacterium]|nr:TRAP transporter substrate-binding protein DctP [Dehalococcoidales bacterium]
ALPAGAIEMIAGGGAWFSGLVPEVLLHDALFMNEEDYTRWGWDLENGGGLEYYVTANFVAQNLRRFVTTPYSGGWGGTCFVSGKKVPPLRKMEDFKGLVIRVDSQAKAAMIESWGAKGVVMSSADIYLGLQLGTLDAGCTAITSVRDRKLYEVSPCTVYVAAQHTPQWIFANDTWWRSLTSEQRNILEETMRESEIWCAEQGFADLKPLIEFLNSKGHEVYTYDDAEMARLVEAYKPVLMQNMVIPIIGEETYAFASKLLDAVRSAPVKRSWREIMETRPFPQVGDKWDLPKYQTK